METLTAREREVARLRAQGLKAKQIAAQLNVAVKTIQMNSYRIDKKLGVKTRAQFVRAADQMGLGAENQGAGA